MRSFLPELLLLTIIVATTENSKEDVFAWNHKQIYYYYF